MASSQDLALSNNDLIVIDGDFAISESDEQHVADTLNAFPGWWKENPVDGVGVFRYLNSTGKEQEIARSIKLNLQSDGYQVGNPSVEIDDNGKLTIDPKAIKI